MAELNEGARMGEIETVERELSILYDQLTKTGERNSVINIRKACEALIQGGCARLTTAAVGRYCEQNSNGPKPQSISNKPETLAAYVKKWDQLHQLRRGRPSNKLQKRVPISDPSVAAYVSVIEVERDEAIRARDRLLQAFRRLEPLQFVGSDRAGAAPSDGLSLSDIECDSLRAFLAPEHLASFGLSYDEKSRILDGRRVLMESPLVRLLLKLASPELRRQLGAA